MPKRKPVAEPPAGQPPAPAPVDTAEPRHYLSAYLGAEEYAVPLSRVQEVVAHANLTRVPTAPAFIEGLLSLHGTVVPVIDLARRFGARPTEAGAQRSILVVQVEIKRKSALIGIVVDRLGRLTRVTREQILPPPPLESLVAVEFLVGVFEGAGRLVLCLDVDRVLGADECDQVRELARGSEAGAAPAERIVRRPYLAVRLAGEHCALSLARLLEIMACTQIVRIPDAPAYVVGATNVRGSIVPVIDLARRYGLAATRLLPESCLVLVEVGSAEREAPVGLLVEAVDGLVHLSPDSIDRTPPFGTHFPTELVEGMAPVSGEFIPILDTERALATRDQRGQPAPDHP